MWTMSAGVDAYERGKEAVAVIEVAEAVRGEGQVNSKRFHMLFVYGFMNNTKELAHVSARHSEA